MATEIYNSDNIKEWYGTNQVETCVKFGSSNPYQIVGLVPCLPENNDSDKYDDPCNTLDTFTGYKNSFLFEYVNISKSVDFRLFKKVSGSWVQQTTLTDDTYGTYYDLGDISGFDRYAGYEVDWSEVYTAFGSGIYRFSAYNSVIPPNSLYSLPFHLRDYSKESFHDHVYIETTYNGVYSNKDYTDDSDTPKTFDLSGVTFSDYNVYKGKLIPTSPESEEENVRYSNNRTEIYYADERQAYDLRLYSPTFDLAKRLFHYGLKGSKIYITTNNVDDIKHFDRHNIIGTSDFSFESFRYYNKIEDVVFKVLDEYASDFSKK